jgi:hypothetical protein
MRDLIFDSMYGSIFSVDMSAAVLMKQMRGGGVVRAGLHNFLASAEHFNED